MSHRDRNKPPGTKKEPPESPRDALTGFVGLSSSGFADTVPSGWYRSALKGLTFHLKLTK